MGLTANQNFRGSIPLGDSKRKEGDENTVLYKVFGRLHLHNRCVHDDIVFVWGL